MVRFLFDNTVVDDPSNWIDLKSKLKRGETNNAVLLTIDGKFDFTGTAYDYLRELYNDNVCAVVDVTIQDNCNGDWVDLVRGTIYVTDCIFNEKTCSVNAEVVDKSYFARINNNKSIEITITSDRSKNGVTINAITPYLVDLYNPSSLYVPIRLNVPCYRVYDVFRYCIDFMTDGTVGFASSLFEAGGDWEGLCIATGYRLRTGGSDIFTPFSFDTLFREINNRIPIVILIENPFDAPVLRIETTSYLSGATDMLTLDNLEAIISSTDTSKIYSAVKMGCPTVDEIQYYIPDQIRYFCHRFEQFAFVGECNTDRVLDLSCEWICSTTATYSSLGLGDQSFDNNIFLIETDYVSATDGVITRQNYLGLTAPFKYWYNPRLTNQSILERYFEDVPNSIVSYLSVTGTGTFKAYNDVTATVVAPATNPSFNFLDVRYNIGSYYNSFDTFVAQELGVYTFEVSFDYTLVSSPISVWIVLDTFDGTGASAGSYTLQNPISIGSSQTITRSVQITLPQSYSVKVWVRYQGSGTVDIGTGSYFTCTDNTVAGGIWQSNDPRVYSLLNFDFECPLTATEWNTIINNQTSGVLFAMNGQVLRRGYIQQAEYNHINRTAKIKLTASKDQVYAS